MTDTGRTPEAEASAASPTGSVAEDAVGTPKDGERAFCESDDEDDDVLDCDDGDDGIHNRLDWRLDPRESYSDWTVEVSVPGSVSARTARTGVAAKTIDSTYHVHKSVLALGDRRSGYFANLFRSRFAETHSRTSSIELPKPAADAFPAFLDYIYRLSPADGRDSVLSTTNALPLYHLAMYFQVKQLRREAKRYWRTDLSLKNAHVYYLHSAILHNDSASAAVIGTVAENILRVDKRSKLLHVTEPKFWNDVFQHPATNECDLVVSEHWSVIMAEFCSIHDGLTADEFDQLTSEERLGRIHPEAAQLLMVLETRIKPDSGTADGILTSLQSRCIRGLARSWADLEVEREETIEFLRGQNPALLTELFALFTSRAQVEHMTLDGERRILQKQHLQLRASFDRLRQQYESESMAHAMRVRELERSRNELLRIRTSLQSEVDARQQTAQRLQAEIDEWHSMDSSQRIMQLEEENGRLLHLQAATANDLLHCEQEKAALEDELSFSQQREQELLNELADMQLQLDNPVSPASQIPGNTDVVHPICESPSAGTAVTESSNISDPSQMIDDSDAAHNNTGMRTEGDEGSV